MQISTDNFKNLLLNTIAYLAFIGVSCACAHAINQFVLPRLEIIQNFFVAGTMDIWWQNNTRGIEIIIWNIGFWAASIVAIVLCMICAMKAKYFFDQGMKCIEFK
ncbi:hypothetical protein [uncultured Pseudoteredinibacter sp.]|uniref:hypothetical protein n=1 Tax=uncultured Pseudoteredinibacter sp. TaxID=1641701 RepID=UPI002602C088|nr:hypothetical protein [uncultured Pseudoteredinibacter sp.]